MAPATSSRSSRPPTSTRPADEQLTLRAAAWVEEQVRQGRLGPLDDFQIEKIAAIIRVQIGAQSVRS